MRNIVFVFAAGAVALAGTVAEAATTSHANRASLEATLGATVIDDYSNPGYSYLNTDAAMSMVLGETDYQATGHANKNYVPNLMGEDYYCAGCNGSFLLSFNTTSVGSASGVFGIGFEYFNGNSQLIFNPIYHAFVTFGDGSNQDYSLSEVSLQAFDGFFGITSDLLITSVHLGLAGGATSQQGFFGLDNLTIGDSANVSPVPVPATLPLLIVGLGALGLNARRRKRT